MLSNSSGSFSIKKPRHTNPANYSLPPRQSKDDILNPIITSEDVIKGDLKNLYTSTSSGFRNQPYDLGWRTYKDLADHANMHVINNTFGASGQESRDKLLQHQTLMFNGMLSGMSFLRAHKYALRFGPKPVNT